MGFFNFANDKELRRVEVPDSEGDWVEVKAEFSKKDVRQILKNAPKQTNDVDGVLDWQEDLFELIIVAWSFVDANDKMIPCTKESYRKLNVEATRWLDALIEETVTPVINKDAADEKKRSN